MTMKMTKKEAIAITGGLSNTSKMPCKSYGLPAAECVTGSKLRKKKGSVCSDCYACKGMYRFDAVQKAQYVRLGKIYDKNWVDAMVTLIGDAKYFRWHDSGDVQGPVHLQRIFSVCERTPKTKHWLPTRELGIVYAGTLTNLPTPDNLIIRISSPMIDQPPIKAGKAANFYTCSVHTKFDKEKFGKECRAYTRDGHCGKCRACWDKNVPNVSYPKH